jgi:hypothetical protein
MTIPMWSQALSWDQLMTFCDARFGACYGHKLSIERGPKSANSRLMHRSSSVLRNECKHLLIEGLGVLNLHLMRCRRNRCTFYAR